MGCLTVADYAWLGQEVHSQEPEAHWQLLLLAVQVLVRKNKNKNSQYADDANRA